MRYCLLVVLFAVPTLAAQDGKQGPSKAATRYGLDYVPNLYPQAAPKEAIASVIKAIDASRIDYLLAQLADPRYVDRQVNDYKTQFPASKDEARSFLAFDKLVRETTAYFQGDPLLIRDLRRFAREGSWEVNDEVAVGTVKELPARKVFLRKQDDRWFLENRQQ